ncbi:adenylate kinase [Pseudonocardia acaciae]|uniref:adenylate kinase n=1 Tax=Pseudonocardia acaciae TaxID=551276 RepID=UPI0006860401|nr:adenylate kinase [Pseudonocardia acaciae]
MRGPESVRGIRRIVIYGVTGSGKTTLASRLGATVGIRWHEVDNLTWEPGWVGVPADEQRRRFEEICAGDEWILDTAYSSWLDLALGRAQLIVALDYPRWVSLSRLVRRTLARTLDGRPICNGNRETLRQAFSPDSIVAFHFRSFQHKRTRVRAWETDESVPPVVRLRSPRHTRAWLATLREPGHS